MNNFRCTSSRCGPAQHSIELAGRGAHVYALDNHAGMLSYANELAAAAGARITFLEADMEDFSLPVGSLAAYRRRQVSVLSTSCTAIKPLYCCVLWGCHPQRQLKTAG